MHFGVSREELLNPLGLAGREVVGNKLNLLAARADWRPTQRTGSARAAYILGRQCARPQPIPQFLALTRRQVKLGLMHAS